MAKSFYKHIGENWKDMDGKIREIYKKRLEKWRKQDRFVKLDKPTRLDKARALGYKAKKGFIVVRGRIKKGGRSKPSIKKGRRPKRAGENKFSPGKSHQQILEERVQDKYPNLEVLNSYWVGEDGNRKWFEVIMVNPDQPEIKSDEDINWITEEKNRVNRGETASAKKSRGLKNKGKGSEKKS